jgi:hypothetical protein
LPKKPWYSAFETAWRWGSFIFAHALVGLVLVAVVYVFQSFLLHLGDPKLFDIVPLRYVFDGMDVGIIIAFLVFGTIEAVIVFKGSDDDKN